MKISASFTRTVGLPGRCTLGASCTVETETKSTDRDVIDEAIATAHRTAIRAVEAQIAAQLDLHTTAPEPPPAPAPRPAPAPGPEPALEPRPRGPAPLPGTAPRNGRTAAGGFDPESPTDGRQLLAMLRRLDKEGNGDYLPTLNQWAKKHGMDWKVINWQADDVSAAVDYLDTVRRPAVA